MIIYPILYVLEKSLIVFHLCVTSVVPVLSMQSSTSSARYNQLIHASQIDVNIRHFICEFFS